MKIYDRGNEVEVSGISDFNLSKTFECGQCFRWKKDEHGAFTGVANGRAVRVRQNGDKFIFTCSVEDFESLWRYYFDLDRDYTEVRRQLCIDEFMEKATAYGAGIHILKQDKWEALCSFIISQNNNISRIKTIIEKFCSVYGELFTFCENQHYTFPTAEKIASVDAKDLGSINCGYRAEYIIDAARMVACRKIDLDALASGTIDAARAALKKIHGVGDKVADCVMLFGLHKLDAFPVDVWMKRAVAKYYGPDFSPEIFRPYAGLAQQYIFHYIRSCNRDKI